MDNTNKLLNIINGYNLEKRDIVSELAHLKDCNATISSRSYLEERLKIIDKQIYKIAKLNSTASS